LQGESADRHEGFSHEALMYAGEEQFVAGTSSFIRAGLDGGAAVMVAVSARKIDLLREALDDQADEVRFVDMAVVGSNPARIIPAWSQFVDENSSARPVWGIGEPIYPERSPAELVECQRHESLLNVAFADARRFRLLCPYDTTALGEAVIHEALCSHPVVVDAGGERHSLTYRGLEAIVAPFDAPLPDPPAQAKEMSFRGETLGALRRQVARWADEAGLAPERKPDLILAVDEVATNSIRYGGGRGVLKMWSDAQAVICEIRDGGYIENPLAGRVRPSFDQVGGWGLWLANQLCELVQIRTSPHGTAVRLHTPLRGVPTPAREP
jgi:anti-sigma regulatory factor (Ser/Thr protein kinase)